jgi:hypothetical protein
LGTHGDLRKILIELERQLPLVLQRQQQDTVFIVRVQQHVGLDDQLAQVGSAMRGSEKVLTKNGASYVALVDARKLDYYHALEAEHAGLVLVQGALEGLADLEAGRVLEEAELGQALAIVRASPRKKA